MNSVYPLSIFTAFTGNNTTFSKLFTYPHHIKWVYVDIYTKFSYQKSQVYKQGLIQKISTAYTQYLKFYIILITQYFIKKSPWFYTYPQHLYILLVKYLYKGINIYE